MHVEIIICGSTRNNHPTIHINNFFEKRIKFQGFGGNQFISINNTLSDDEDSIIDLESDNVTIIVNEPKDSQDLIVNYAELKNSPIEINNLVLLNGDSDLISLSSIRNTLYTVSLQIFDLTNIAKIKMGINFITFLTKDQTSNLVTLYEYDMSMDIVLSLKQDHLDFTADSKLQKEGTENNILADFEIGEDKKATVTFDSTWNSLQKIDFIKIRHNCKLEISSDKKEIAQSIEVFGEGEVTRNGKIDNDDDVDSSVDDGNDDGHINQGTDKNTYSTLVLACVVVVAIIIIATGVFIIYKKKCRRIGNQNFNDYLNNADDLADMEAPLEN